MPLTVSRWRRHAGRRRGRPRRRPGPDLRRPPARHPGPHPVGLDRLHTWVPGPHPRPARQRHRRPLLGRGGDHLAVRDAIIAAIHTARASAGPCVVSRSGGIVRDNQAPPAGVREGVVAEAPRHGVSLGRLQVLVPPGSDQHGVSSPTTTTFQVHRGQNVAIGIPSAISRSPRHSNRATSRTSPPTKLPRRSSPARHTGVKSASTRCTKVSGRQPATYQPPKMLTMRGLDRLQAGKPVRRKARDAEMHAPIVHHAACLHFQVSQPQARRVNLDSARSR